MILLLLCFAYASACSDGYFEPQPVDYYTFPSSNLYLNSGSRGAALSGTTSKYSTGVVGDSIEFDGKYDLYMNAPNIVPVPFSLCFWMKPTNPTNTYYLCHWYVDGINFLQIYQASSRLYFYFMYNNVVGSATSGTLNGDWRHFCVTYDGGTLTMYENGAYVISNGVTLGSIKTMWQKAVLGARYDHTQKYVGLLDEFRLYDSALAASDVTQIYEYRGSSTICALCTANYYCVNDIRTACYENSNSAAGATDCVCNSGFMKVDRQCRPCVAGTVMIGLTCKYCDAGTYSSAAGLTKCTDCAVGTYSSAPGASVCPACTACSPFATQLAPCSATSNNASCQCNAGYVGDGYSCSACAAGTYKTLNTCSTCAAGESL